MNNKYYIMNVYIWMYTLQESFLYKNDERPDALRLIIDMIDFYISSWHQLNNTNRFAGVNFIIMSNLDTGLLDIKLIIARQ